ncbi:MAG: sulfatase [Planctomycetales bacterium]|nr:sulfatase [Planctomycetales bacterium]MCA9169838.1 sulfatase [Planctomycetales bacterium]
MRTYLVLVSSLLFGATTFAAESPNRPNLVVFLIDDFGWQDTSVSFFAEQTPQNRHFRTPNMERLARQGVKFRQAYACCVCSPTRSSILTGYNAARHGITNWILHPDKETSAKTPHLAAPVNWRRGGIQPGEITLPGLLRERYGYRTIHVGKAHWGAHGTPGSEPMNLGFDVNIAGHAAGSPGHYHGEKNYGNKEKGGLTEPWGVPGLEKYHGTDVHLSDALTLEAIAAVEQSVAEQTPFFLYFAHYAVHTPIQSHPRFMSHYQGQNFPGTNIPIDPIEARYASLVEGIDASLGDVLQALDRLDVARNTIVVFLSDNGGLSRHARGTSANGGKANTHNIPLREGKGSAYEGGTRIPFLCSWAQPAPEEPQQAALPIAQAAVQDLPIIVEDLFPSLLHWASAGTANPPLPRDGRDITPLLTHHVDAQAVREFQQRPLVFHYPHHWNGGVEGGYQPHSSIRVGDAKAIYFYENRRWELYDLANDLSEQHDLAEQHPAQLQQLATQLQILLHDRNAQWPYDFVQHEDEPLRLP